MPKKIDAVSEGYYAPFFTRGKQRNNTANNEENLLVMMYERILGELAMNRFQWTGFPDYVDLRFIELTLHQYGLVVVFKDTGTTIRPGTDRIFALRGTPTGQRTITDNPVSFTLTGPGMNQRFQGVQLSSRLCVPIWSNYFRQTDWDIISIYSRKLAKIDRTIDINMDSARRTKVLVYDENTRLTAENLNRQINEGQPTVRVKYDIGSMMQALDLGVEPKSLETLSVLRARIWSEAMGLLGINNANQDKKERLVESEVDANVDQVENMRRVNLNARQYACMQMQKMFPEELGNVSVDYFTTITAPDLPEQGEVMEGAMMGEGGRDDADIHA
jgi:hypothetical protein